MKHTKRGKHQHVHHPSKIEFVLAILIVAALIISLTTRKLVYYPRYFTIFLIILFLITKIHHIWKEGGALLEDYTTIGAVMLFIVLFAILRENINTLLTTVFIFILIYSTGLMLWIQRTFESKKIVHFLISYITTIIMVILLFAGAFTSGNGLFTENGKEKQLSFHEALYVSVITFTTVGFGDISPIGINRLFASLEALLGIIINIALIGYLLASGRYSSAR
ncbi:MAG: Ion channel [archaeon]|jgi:prepilin signal peptidase PulO-like enzyme (type II secretory pathway)